MNERVEKIVTLAGNSNKYQYFILFLTTFLWININTLSISLAYLERMPIIGIKNDQNIIEITQLNYTICDLNKNHNISFTIEKNFNNSWICEYEIFCDKFLVGAIGSMSFLGSFIGCVSFQFFSNYFGRKKIAGICLLLLITFTFCIVFVNNIKLIIILCAGIQISSTMINMSTYMLCCETVDLKMRGMFSCIINAGYSLGGIFYILLIKYANNWRYVFLISSLNCLKFGLLFILVARESYRFYLANGQIEKFLSVLLNIASFNERNQIFNEELKCYEYQAILTEIKSHYAITSNYNTYKYIVSLPEKAISAREIQSYLLEKNTSSNNQKFNFLDFFRYKSVKFNFMAMCFLWFFSGANYLGIGINIKNLPGDIYMNGIIIYSMEIISYILSGYLIDLIGRKMTLYIYYMITILSYSSLSIFAIVNYKFEIKYILLITYAGIFTISGIFTILYTYTLELYPTVLRNQGFSCNLGLSRIAGAIIPMAIEIFSNFFLNSLFSIINVFCLILIVFLPETQGKPLNDFIPELLKIKSQKF